MTEKQIQLQIMEHVDNKRGIILTHETRPFYTEKTNKEIKRKTDEDLLASVVQYITQIMKTTYAEKIVINNSVIIFNVYPDRKASEESMPTLQFIFNHIPEAKIDRMLATLAIMQNGTPKDDA